MKNLNAANRWNADLIDQHYNTWLNAPEMLTPEWRAFFEGFELAAGGDAAASTSSNGLSRSELLMLEALEAYRAMGHTQATLDPLSTAPRSNPLLSEDALGLTAEVLASSYHFPTYRGGQTVDAKTLIEALKKTYCGNIGYEYLHIQDPVKRQWLEDAIETDKPRTFSTAQKCRMLEKITQGEAFERFLHTRFVGQKRFSLEGGEVLMAALDLVAQEGPEMGIEEIYVGMAHRGRLNVLTNYIGKSHVHLFRDFTEGYLPDNSYGDGDVKYHLGYHKTHTTIKGKKVDLHLAYNPSHLEAVNAIVSGSARARQDEKGNNSTKKVLPLVIHGDAAVIGQGIVAELMNLARLKGYTTGGTLHIVINNQIGFTTNPIDARSTPYCTDFAKVIEAPIFHVNGDDPLAVGRVIQLALEYRQQFGEDVFIDIVCYRKYGHNETDEPTFTQPARYRAVAEHTALGDSFAAALVSSGDLKEGDLATIYKAHLDYFEKCLSEAKVEFAKKAKAIAPQPAYTFKGAKTALPAESLRKLGQGLTTAAKGFKINPKIERQLQAKAAMLKTGTGFDWSMGEALAYASLLAEGHPIRLSGQDCERGTFSHRHAVLNDFESGLQYTPLNHVAPNQAPFSVYNSALSEEAVLGFDYGYSLNRADSLTIWEAQFGDFANGAQVMIDQFITSAESKWGSLSNLTLLLPHGYEGQGPEHSSARLERFLQACAEDNIQVCNVTTPAQLFHLLRRQVKQTVKKPLVIMSPKSLLRHKGCVSELAHFTKGTFSEILEDAQPAKKTTRLVLCTGKVYYDLLAAREERKDKGTTIIRLEQLYPLNTNALSEIVKGYKGFKTLVWCQEEPKNMGAYSYIAPLLEDLTGMKPLYAGRKLSASPAVGALARHKLEQTALLEQAFTL